MGPDEMREIATSSPSSSTRPPPAWSRQGPNRGKPSLVQYRLDDTVAATARHRVADRLARFPVYPDIEL